MLAYILIGYVHELALAKGTKKAFRIAKAAGRRAASTGQQINIMRLHKFENRSAVVNEVAGIAYGIVRISGSLRRIAMFSFGADDEFRLGQRRGLVTCPRLAIYQVGLSSFRSV